MNQPDASRHNLSRSLLAVAIGLAVSATAQAYDPRTALGGFGQTTLQQQTGDAVTLVCGGLAQRGSRTALQQDLFDRCGNMVGNANELAGINAGPVAKSLGLSANELAAAVQTVANEEIASTRTMNLEMGSARLDSGLSRLRALRSGVSYGLAGLTTPRGATVAQLDPRLQGATGGAAGGDIAPKWGFFATGLYGFGDREQTDREDGFDYDRWGLIAGADYRLSDNFVLGGMIGYSSIESDFDVSPAVPGGGIDAEAWSFGVYSTYYQDNWYLDGLLAYNQTDYDIDRRILLPLGATPGNSPAAVETSRAAKGNTSGSDWAFSLGGGMDLTKDNLTYGPYARLNYISGDIDGYNETGAGGLNLTATNQSWSSLTSVLGGRISSAMSQSWGVLVPQARVGWVHEFQNDSETFTAFYTVDPNRLPLLAASDDPDRDYFTLGLGLSAVMPNNVQAYIDYQTLLDHKYLNDHLFSAGVRIGF